MRGEPIYMPFKGDLAISEESDHAFQKVYHLRLIDERGVQLYGGNNRKAICGHSIWGDTMLQLRNWNTPQAFNPKWCKKCEEMAHAKGIKLGPGAKNINEMRRYARLDEEAGH